MTEIPKFETICDLFEQKPNAWEKVRPYLHLALMLAPGALFGSFGTLVGTLGALDSGLTLSGAVELLENTLFHTKGLFRKKPDFTSPFDLPRLANTMVIFAAWFDTLEEEAHGLWQGLELDEGGFQWMQEECQSEYRRVQELVGGDGRNILISDGREMLALKQFYVLLMEKTRKLAQGLAATENQRADWAHYPKLAVKKYCRYCEILKKYDTYRSWVGQQYLESILRILLDQQPQPSREPGKLHLPASSSLLESGLFRGRKKDLAKIERTFAEQDIVVLTGLGGMGKTELAIKYACERKKSGTAEVYFLSFQSSFQETIARAAMEGLAEYTNQKLTTKEAFPIAWGLLLKSRKEDLLILDNVDTSAQTLNAVIKELSKLPMRCLVTTRHRSAGAIEVGKLSEEELLQIFDDNDAPVSREDRLRLINAVDRHTLTVSLIAQTLQGGMVKAKTILDALEKQNFDDIPLPEVDAHFPGAEEQKKIYVHLRTVFRMSNMSDGARLAMTCAVLLPQGGMDADTFQSALDKEAADALFSLSRNGWLSWHDDLISIHPVIRLVCKNELPPTDEICGPFLDRLWDQRDPMRYDKTLYRQYAELFTTASTALEDSRGNWSLLAGHFRSELGDHRRALEFQQTSLAIREKFLPGDHLHLAQSYNNVGYTYGKLGDHRKELEFKQKALAIREKALPGDHPHLATSYNNVGLTYGELGDHSKSLEFGIKALTIRESILPEDHPDLAASYNNVGGTYGELGDHRKELEFKQKALAIWERVLPRDHPLLALSYNNVGSTYVQLGDHSNALEFLLKALAIREKVLPGDHPDLAASYNNVGLTYGHLGDHSKALEFGLKALAISEKFLPGDHPDLAASYNNVGSTYGNLRDHSKALEFELKALAIWETILPGDHPHLATSYNNVGSTYGELGDHRKALEFESKALAIQERVLPGAHPDIALSCSNIALTLAHMSQFPEALPYIRRAVTIAERSLHEGHPDLANFRRGARMVEIYADLQEKGIDFGNPFK